MLTNIAQTGESAVACEGELSKLISYDWLIAGLVTPKRLLSGSLRDRRQASATLIFLLSIVFRDVTVNQMRRPPTDQPIHAQLCSAARVFSAAGGGAPSRSGPAVRHQPLGFFPPSPALLAHSLLPCDPPWMCTPAQPLDQLRQCAATAY